MGGLTDEEAASFLGVHPDRFPDWTQGVIITDDALADNPIIYANAGFEALTGYMYREIVGRNCRFLQGPGTNASTVTAIRDAVAERRRFNGDILNYRKDGTVFWNHLSLGPLPHADRPGLFVGLQLDVSKRYAQDNFLTGRTS